MTVNVIKVILYVLVNIAGFYAIPVIANLAVKVDMFPQLPPGIHTENFKYWFMAIGMWVWIGTALFSTGYFFARDDLKHWLLFAPMYITGSYAVAVLVYFNFFYTL